jgi:hypothetical protein
VKDLKESQQAQVAEKSEWWYVAMDFSELTTVELLTALQQTRAHTHTPTQTHFTLSYVQCAGHVMQNSSVFCLVQCCLGVQLRAVVCFTWTRKCVCRGLCYLTMQCSPDFQVKLFFVLLSEPSPCAFRSRWHRSRCGLLLLPVPAKAELS